MCVFLSANIQNKAHLSYLPFPCLHFFFCFWIYMTYVVSFVTSLHSIYVDINVSTTNISGGKPFCFANVTFRAGLI